MSEPKRHHWWPQLQSGHWGDSSGNINVIAKDGVVFRTKPKNIGVEGQLYSFISEKGIADPEIEHWLADEIDGPFDRTFPSAFDLNRIVRVPAPRDQERTARARELGILGPHGDALPLSHDHKTTISNYVAALLVRNPYYLDKLKIFHKENNPSLNQYDRKNAALRNMLWLYNNYRTTILEADFLLSVRKCDIEFLFGDSGIVAREPWSKVGLPFDLHVPLTPNLALGIIPVREPSMEIMPIVYAGNAMVRRQNRNILADAKRFVFSRCDPPIRFIKRYFAVPAPMPFGHRYRNGRLETKYFRNLDSFR